MPNNYQGLPAAMYSACIEMCVGKRKNNGIVNHKDILISNVIRKVVFMHVCVLLTPPSDQSYP